MRILLDLQGCQSASRLRDIGRISLSLAKAMVRNAGSREIWLLLNDQFPDTVLPLRREFAGLVPPDRIAVFSVPGPTGGQDPANAARARVAEFVREYAIAELALDLVLVASLFEGYRDDAVTSVELLGTRISTAVCLYDHVFDLEKDGSEAGPAGRDYYRRKIESLKRADLVLALSRSVGREATSALGIAAERVVEIAPAADERFRPSAPQGEADENILRRAGLSRPFVLYVGATGPRANVEGLIRAFAALPGQLRSVHQLLLVVPGDEEAREGLRGVGLSLGLVPPDLIVLDQESDEDLGALYRACRLFVAPPLHDGVALPALDAMACGAAVIGSNTGCIPEAIGHDDALFDPSAPDAIVETLRRALTDDAFNRSLRQHGLEQSRSFSWDASARRALEAFDALLAERRDCAQDAARPGAYERLIAMTSEWTRALPDQDLLRTAEAIAANGAVGAERQLLVDVSRIVEHDERTGIQRVVRAISKALLEEPPPGFQVRPIWFDPHTGRYRWALAFSDTVMGRPAANVHEDWVEAHRGDLFLGLDLAYDRVTRADSWLRAQRRRGVHIVFVVYDTLPAHHPEWFPAGVSDGFIDWIVWIAGVSDMLLTISKAVADDLRAWLGANLPRTGEVPDVRYFHLGSNLGDSAPSRGLPGEAPEVLAKLGRATTFLTVGTLEPRKGHRQVVEAFERLWDDGIDVNLVIVGKRGWMIGDLLPRLQRHSRTGRHLFWLEAISDEYLERVYAASTCLIAASLGEGFGLPLIEGAQHGLPIIARDLPVFREVAGEHAYYFSGTSPEALADAVSNWMELHAEGKAPSSEGMSWLSWAESARQLMDVVLGQGGGPSHVPKGDGIDAAPV